jgi:predicted esterase
MNLQQQGEGVTGTFGPLGQFPLKGTVRGRVLTFEYEEGAVRGSGQFTIGSGEHAFTGSFQIQNGPSGTWNGWRSDPTAIDDKQGDFSGTWLTTLGLMEITQIQKSVKGRYAIAGGSTLSGTARGRHLDFQFHGIRDGTGWFDLLPNGSAFEGVSKVTNSAGWAGWAGKRTSEFQRHQALEPGKIVTGSTENLLTYSIRAPETYEPNSSRKWTTILILHGSNMNAQSYVATIAAAWPDIAQEFTILGINGETASQIGGDPRFNYSYINYVGRSNYKGFPGTDRESPALVAEAMKELKQIYPVARYFVGGHSQGGFLTYSLLMNFPELIAGAFPISCGVIFQCEPDAYTDEHICQAQRAVPLAIIHGRNDPLVSVGVAQYAATIFGESNWPAIRLFLSDSGGHMFARLPIRAAIRWLEAQASNQPNHLIDFAMTQFARNEFRDAVAALRRVTKMNLDEGQRKNVQDLTQKIDAKASMEAPKYLSLFRNSKHGIWIDDFLAFRDKFEFADSVRPTMIEFASLRKQHEEPAKKALNEARRLFQEGKNDEGYAKYREIVDKYYASSLYRVVKRWLSEQRP